MNNIKRWCIVDRVNGRECTQVDAQNGKSAVTKFRRGLLSSGIYWTEKQADGWHLISSYGSDFLAVEVKFS